MAEPGGICISGTVYDQIENKMTLGYEYPGEQAVKNITKPVRVYRVAIEPEAAEVLRLSPNYSLEVERQRLPYKDPAALERYLDGLRKAGLK